MVYHTILFEQSVPLQNSQDDSQSQFLHISWGIPSQTAKSEGYGSPGATALGVTCFEPLPIGSMYGIYANIWGILMVNVSIYTIHGSYG